MPAVDFTMKCPQRVMKAVNECVIASAGHSLQRTEGLWISQKKNSFCPVHVSKHLGIAAVQYAYNRAFKRIRL